MMESASGEKRDEGGTQYVGLFVLLARLRLTSETLSDLARDRESFGLGWLTLFLLKQNRALGKNPLEWPRCIDLADTFGLSPKKIFFFLDWFSPLEELKVGRSAVMGKAFPHFVRFLWGLRARALEEGKALKKFTFADGSIGAKEAIVAIPLVMPFLESVCMKGNLIFCSPFNREPCLFSTERPPVPGPR